MYMTYKRMFNTYLDICKSAYRPSGVEDNLRHCIKLCRNFSYELQGMVRLMREMHVIDKTKESEEVKKISETFNSLEICRAYMTEGTVIPYMCQ